MDMENSLIITIKLFTKEISISSKDKEKDKYGLTIKIKTLHLLENGKMICLKAKVQLSIKINPLMKEISSKVSKKDMEFIAPTQ